MTTAVLATHESGSRIAREPRTRREVITPEIAMAWLELNEANRHVSDETVRRYARDMKAGKWLVTGDPIKFGATGRLLDGQHRLWACVEAQVPFESYVIRGLNDEEAIMTVIDTGKKRTLGNVLQIQGVPNGNLIAAIVNSCWKYDNDRWRGPDYPSHEEALDWFRRNPDVHQAALVSKKVFSGIRATATQVGVSYYVNSRIDSAAAEEFWMLAAEGEGLAAGDPILAYRRWVIGRLAQREKPSPQVWLAHNLKAMNLWRDGKKVRILHVKPEEGMPEPWGCDKPKKRRKS